MSNGASYALFGGDGPVDFGSSRLRCAGAACCRPARGAAAPPLSERAGKSGERPHASIEPCSQSPRMALDVLLSPAFTHQIACPAWCSAPL
eukprot:6209454-Pleurochrysis_carterae.AAC.2